MKFKVCGLFNEENINKVAKLNPDYVGHIFWEKSVRYLNIISPNLKKEIKKTGVFFNSKIDNVFNRINEHNIGSEKFKISKSVIDKIIEAKKLNKRVVAVGTTVTRVLEYCFTKKIQNDYEGEVDLYITPGYNFKAINCLITNYHLPKSTLLLLVSSFIDFNYLMTLYKSAIENDYKFYSYGDSMFIDKML